MDLYHKALTVGLATALTGASVIGYEWLQAHDAALKAEAKVAADQAAFDKLTVQQKDLADQLAQVRRDQADGLATVSRQFGQAQSPAQFSALLAQLLGLKANPVIVTPAPTKDNPNPQPVIELPDSPPVKAYFKECEDCKVNLAAAQREAAVSKQDKVIADSKLELMTQERDTLKKAANGGPWIKRAGRTLKIATCAALGGAAGGQRNATGAALGALGGAIACSLF